MKKNTALDIGVGKKPKKKHIRQYVEGQRDRLSVRFGEFPDPDNPKLIVDGFYKEPVEFCIDLFRQGKHMHEAVYLTRLYFTDPRTPRYIPIERWDAQAFRANLIRWIKAD